MTNINSPTYPDRESKILEFKEIIPEFKKLVQTCIAFANGAGGEIIIGVEDKTRSMVGITEKDRDRPTRISQTVYTIQPALF